MDYRRVMMLEKPRPKTELIASNDMVMIKISVMSHDAREFVKKELPEYGNSFTELTPDVFRLKPHDNFDIDEITAYFNSYNDK